MGRIVAAGDQRTIADWVVPSALAVVCASIALADATGAGWGAALDYRREAIAAGQSWRLVTAHLVHVNATHAVLDIAALLLVAWIFVRELNAMRQVTVVIAAIVGIDLALGVLSPEVERYAGLSGVLHAWFAAGATCWLLEARDVDRATLRRAWGTALLLGLATKLALEAGGRGFWLGDAGFEVVGSAHRWGSVVGIALGGAFAFVRRHRRT